MDEYIKRMDAIAAACKGCNREYADEPCEPEDCYIQQGLFKVPAADVVAVVRCKNCEYSAYPEERITWCKRRKVYMPLKGFCSDGREKDGNAR